MNRRVAGKMGDDDYTRKLGEMQKYVPFLESTIKRLKTEKDKPREAQITKLQSLLVILTDSKKKLKLDALKKCEEVILKLYDKVEKKPNNMTMMHKYMCRTPPEEKAMNENNETFLVARQKLKQTDTTPASPSPPLDHQLNIKPVVIPTEKIETPFLQNQNWICNNPNIKLVGNNKEIIPNETCVRRPHPRRDLPLPPAPQNHKSLEKEILPLSKPPLSDKDLQDLLSPVTESSSGGHSPIFNEDMDLDKLEAIKAKLCKELEEEKPKQKVKKLITTTVTSTTTTTTNTITKKPLKIIKEPENIFGNLLSSIDEQILNKNKLKDKEKKLDKDKKVLNKKDVASMNEKVKSIYLKNDDKLNTNDNVNVNVNVNDNDDKVSKTVEDIMKNLKDSISVKAPDPLSKFGDLVKEKSDQLNPGETGRLSDKYPHKRKSIESPSSPPPSQKGEPVNKLTDPRIRLIKEPIIIPQQPQQPPLKAPQQPQQQQQQQRGSFININKPQNPEFSFQNSFNNMNNFNHNLNQNHSHNQNMNQRNIFCNEPPPNNIPNLQNMPFIRPPFMNCGRPQTPADPFIMSPGDPFLNAGRPPGPVGPPGPPGPIGPPPRPPNFNQFRFPQNNWRPFPPNNINQNNNQYDLSQMNPVDFYDNNRFEPPFRGGGRGGMRGNFRGGGRGCPERFRDPRQQFRPPPPLLHQHQQHQPRFPNMQNEEHQHQHKEERRSRFDDPRESRDPRDNRDSRESRDSRDSRDPRDNRDSRDSSRESRDSRDPRDYRRSRFSPNRFGGSSKFSREDPRRKSSDSDDKTNHDVDTSSKDIKEQKDPIIKETITKDSIKEVKDVKETKDSKELKDFKEKEEIQSPLDSLYSTETKRVGKGYGLQSFKIPKIKKIEEPPPPIINKEEPPIKPKEEEPKIVDEPLPIQEVEASSTTTIPTTTTTTTTVEATSSSSDEPPKSEADLKLDMFNNFMKHIFETCDSSVLFQYLDRCGFALPNAKTKRIRRIIDSDSSDTEDEKTTQTTPEPPLESTKQDSEESEIVETLSERIKSRRRKPVIYSSDSSPEKSDKSNKKEEKSSKSGKLKKQAKTRRKNALELLQEDIREMFISEGVLTATGKRMCRMMKEHQESGFIDELKPKDLIKETTESEEEIPLVKRKKQKKLTDKQKSMTRKSPRVLLEKLDKIDKLEKADVLKTDSESEEEIKKPKTPTPTSLRRTRRSNTISADLVELGENGSVKIQKGAKKDPELLDTSFESDVISETLENEDVPEQQPPQQQQQQQQKKKKIRRRGRSNWATGVVKNYKKKKPIQQKPDKADSPTTTSTKSDIIESEDDTITEDHHEMEDDLIKVDTNEDVNYYLDNGNKFSCKLCDYKGKLIVHHYRSKHPESENMISRLSPGQASAAKIESKEFNFEEIVPYEELIKGKKRRTTFTCRFCLLTFKQEFTCSFFDHICCHTGEYRYKCEKCNFSTGVKKTLSTHCHSLHPEMEKPLTIKPIYEGPPNFRLVFGYLCSVCNFTQLLKENLEKHIRASHANLEEQDIGMIKISMSTKPIPLTDLRKPGENENETENEKENENEIEVPISNDAEETEIDDPLSMKEKETIVKEKEPNLTVFMVPEEISQQEKQIENERLKKMEEIQSNVVPRRSKLQFVDKLKNKLDSVESEIALLESMEAENAATLEASTSNVPLLEREDVGKIRQMSETKAPPEDSWISIASTCSLAAPERERETETEPELEQENTLESLDVLTQNTKKQSGFMDTIQRLAAQLQNKPTTTSLSDEDAEPLYYSPELTPQPSPKQTQVTQETVEDILYKLNSGSIEIDFFSNKNKYNCLIRGCNYSSFLKTSFRKHLMDEHKNLRVNCGLCVDDFIEWDLCGLFLHMLDQHRHQTPVKSVAIKQEPVEQEPVEQEAVQSPQIAIKTEVVSPVKPVEEVPAGSIRLRRISGDLLSSFSAESSENSVEYPTISIPETQPQSQPQPGFLQISNVRTLTPEEESHLQIKTPTTVATTVAAAAASSSKVIKKLIPKAIILNMGELATPDNPTKTIIFRKPPFDTTALTLSKGFPLGSRKITFVAPPQLKQKTNEPIKSVTNIQTKLEYPKIMDFYKCPFDCAFTTNERVKFGEHFLGHGKTTPGKYCIYCDVTLPPGELLDHMERTHSSCNYQCALCFYRASFDMYIAAHQSAVHQIEIPKYYICPKFTTTTLPIGLDDDLLAKGEAILPYYCALKGCNRTFYTMNDFRVHMKIYHKRHNVCSICKQGMSNCELLIGHYVTHNIAHFQCRYCKFGSERPQNLLKHYAVEHFNKNPIVYKREYKTGTMSPNISDSANLDDIIEINLSYLTKNIPFMPINPPETQNHIPAGSSSAATDEPFDDFEDEPQIAPELLEPITELIDPTTGEMIPVVNTDEEDEEMYEDSGLSGRELFICGTSECGTTLENLKDFKDHLYSCDVLKHDEGWYTCFHCKKRFKYVGALIKHLSVHGPQKYSCSLCPAKSHQSFLIIKHMKVQHKIANVKIIPIDKQSQDTEYQAVVVKQRVKKSRKDDELYEKELQDAIKYTKEQIEMIENEKPQQQVQQQQQHDKNSFGPEDIDKLPRPPIFAHEIKCKICSYSTKVRSNMLIHLKAHIENKPVAEIAPVNPVPCLEKNELMFDKMTNLAASSHSGGRMGPKPPKEKTMDYPSFIAASKRYVCGATGCNYLTHGDSMLRHHLTALHLDELNYKCPHCQTELAPDGLTILAVDNILFHLKMHDLHLYKCTECQFYHYQRHKMERHLVDQHPNSSKSAYAVVRELDNSANVEVVRQTNVDKPADVIDEPWRCGFCDFKCPSRTGVQAHAANVHKIRSQFKCGCCEFRCSAKNNYQTHFKNKHPNQKVVILSVYYKITDQESGSNLSSSDVESNRSFDTTPLWTKNKTGVKHIRGILLDDSPISKSRPKIIEKMSENFLDDATKSPKDKTHNLRFPATFGSNRMRFYVCPACNSFETKNSKQFVIHLYKEINYFRYMCNFCSHKSTHMAEAQKHYKEVHSDETVVSNKQICNVLRYYAKAEKWVEKCLQTQQEGIQKYEMETTCNSSTETLLLQDPLEMDELTPQKSSLNESFESSESLKSDDLSPPVLEIQVPGMPDIKPQKKPVSVLKCEHCPFVAKAPSNLHKHIKKHFEAKPYKCNLCSYTGSQLAHLQSHFYFKHTSQPLQYTLEAVPDVPQVHPIKRKRSISENTEQPSKIPALEEHEPFTIKAEPLEHPCVDPQDLEPIVQIKTEMDSTNSVFVCFHCPRRSPSLDLIREHFMESHEKLYKNNFKYKKLTIDKPRKKEYSCKFCEWTGHPDALKQHHLVAHIDKEFNCTKDVLLKCEHCNEVFSKIASYRKHFRREHPDSNMLYQIITKENDDVYVESIEVVEEILDIKQETQEINCEYCVLSFTSATDIRAHHDLVHSHLTFNLIEEGEGSSTRDELKKYKCPQCQHTSNSFPAMRDHLRNHNKPYKCGYCDLTASYPNVIKTHHMKEHRNLEAVVLVINEAHKRNEELRDNLLHLVNGEYIKMKDNNLKRSQSEANPDEPPSKMQLLDEDSKKKLKRKKSPVKNVARKSTATAPRLLQTARKSTTPRPLIDQGFTYYGTKPLLFDEIKNIKTELPILGKNMSLNIGSMSQILQLFPVVEVDDIGEQNT